MRPLRYSINVTLDGCCDHREIPADEDLDRHAAENIAQADALLFGRVTYEMTEGALRSAAGTGGTPDSTGTADLRIAAAQASLVSVHRGPHGVECRSQSQRSNNSADREAPERGSSPRSPRRKPVERRRQRRAAGTYRRRGWRPPRPRWRRPAAPLRAGRTAGSCGLRWLSRTRLACGARRAR
jgi:hypothetical protein